jgi:hypothetical protein
MGIEKRLVFDVYPGIDYADHGKASSLFEG